MSAGDTPAERTTFTDEMFLPDELVQVARAHPGRQRLLPGGWLEEGFGSGARGPPGGWHERMVAPVSATGRGS
jgi:hypothetical protein